MTVDQDADMKMAWIAAVDRLMKRDWCVDTADAGLSDDDLARYWQNGDEPAEFVAWFAEKYDLIRYEPGPIRMRPASSPPRA
ncbi:hypothetical protein BH09PSE1_BH09PSE1_24400 [soil metagenome]